MGDNRLEDFDIIIVGAGLSGIGAACRFKMTFGASKKIAILESRNDLGGTWDLFRYPGIRSDSDMYTLSFTFRPWKDHERAISDGPAIKQYLRDTAVYYGIDQLIRYGQKVKKATYSNVKQQWTLDVEVEGNTIQYTTGFMFMCCGYYRYDTAYTPHWDTLKDFKGTVIHPQFWPEDIDLKGKKVVVIGSGATAISLVPAIAKEASHVIMLQRTPTYVVAMPTADSKARILHNVLPENWASFLTRLKNIYFTTFTYWLSRACPSIVRLELLRKLSQYIGAEDIQSHFTPPYNPWDQRICVVADADLFSTMKEGKSSVVTDHIDHFTSHGIALKSGKELDADIIITATGLVLQLNGGIEIVVDDKQIDFSKELVYKGMMMSGIPNAAFAIGYTNASWTLKVELIYNFVISLLQYMDRAGYREVMPVRGDVKATEKPFFDLESGYVKRAEDILPKQGQEEPWQVHNSWRYDKSYLAFNPEDPALRFFPKD